MTRSDLTIWCLRWTAAASPLDDSNLAEPRAWAPRDPQWPAPRHIGYSATRFQDGGSATAYAHPASRFCGCIRRHSPDWPAGSGDGFSCAPRSQHQEIVAGRRPQAKLNAKARAGNGFPRSALARAVETYAQGADADAARGRGWGLSPYVTTAAIHVRPANRETIHAKTSVSHTFTTRRRLPGSLAGIPPQTAGAAVIRRLLHEQDPDLRCGWI